MASNQEMLVVQSHEVGIRLDKFISKKCRGLAFFSVQKLLRTGQVRVDGHRVKGSFRLALGNRVRIPNFYFSTRKSKTNDQISIKITKNILEHSILYKDENMLAINKPAGLSVQGGTKIKHHIDGILDYLRFGYDLRPQLVHRLDKDTTGVLILARTPDSARKLTLAFKNREIIKNYIAIVHGLFPKKCGIIKMPIEKIYKLNTKKIKDGKNLKEASTEYNVLWKGKYKNNTYSIVEYTPSTGRKHQLRAHSFYMGCPILGDKKYNIIKKNFNDIKKSFKGMYLHAIEIGVPDSEGLTIRIKAPLPNHMSKMFELLGFRELL